MTTPPKIAKCGANPESLFFISDMPSRIKWSVGQNNKGGSGIEVIVHYPETPEKQALFDTRVAKFHAEYVAQYIEKLNCPITQKLKLVDAIAQTILESIEK